ncbi:MAG: T9SS type A sorting domain-containing protein [Calditrichia bacterium]
MRYSLRVVFVALGVLSFSLLAQVQVETVTPNAFNGSGGVVVNAAGEVFVGDFGQTLGGNPYGTTVKQVDLTDGSVSVFATGLNGASGNAFDSQGNLYQSNIGGSFISKIDPAGNVTTFTSTGIAGPVGIAVGANDTVYVANCGNSTIRKIAPDGSSMAFASGGLFNCPNGLTIDENGILYTANFSNGNVIKIEPDGTASILATIPGNNNGHLTYANGRLYVVGRCTNRIYEVSLSGDVTWLAGSGQRGNADGPAASASFSIPNGIAASPDGSALYINDAVPTSGGCFNGLLNQVVLRKITLTTTGVEPIAGSVATDFQLDQNYPNPFNPSTSIRFELPHATDVRLTVFDVSGREVATLVDEPKNAGVYLATFEGHQLPSGVYFYRLQTSERTLVRKMTLNK